MGVLTLVIAGQRKCTAARPANAGRCFGRTTRRRAPMSVEMPDRQTGSPMTYMISGKQYIVVTVSGIVGAQLIAYALP